MTPPPKHTGLTRILKAFGYSWDGLKAAYISEAAFRQELALVAIAAPVSFWLDVSSLEHALMLGSLLLVLIIELINTAIEATIERISPEMHPLSKKAKDLGSAAVLLALINAGAAWAIILLG